MIQLSYTAIANSIIFSIIGLLVFWVGFWTIDRLTPYDLWKQIVEEKNVALALLVGCISLGVCLIIAFAIHG